MFEFGIQNIRRLDKPESFQILPLTILVGRNSSGKSTYLRSIPLLKQSIVTRTSSPILWYGDSVDFGSFEQSIHDNDATGVITFSFRLDEIVGAKRLTTDPDGFSSSLVQFKFSGIQLAISICKYNSGTRISKIVLREETNGAIYDITVSNKDVVTSLQVDGCEMVSLFEDEEMFISSGAIFPQLLTRSKEKLNPSLQSGLVRPDSAISISSALGKIFLRQLDARTTQATLQRLVASLLVPNNISPEALKHTLKGNSNRSWAKLINDLTSPAKTKEYFHIRRILLVALLPAIVNRVCQVLRDTIASSLYIGPARARSERYYRYQDLAVSEIDPDGKNFPMFLSSLTDSQLRNFSSWVYSIFSYGVNLSKESGHISIKLTTDQGDVNVVDTGYGVSQILPVLGQVWWAINRPSRGISRQSSIPMICIEQPELHLHPAHQALLADTFAKAVAGRSPGQASSAKAYLIIETHSETLINRLGQLISDKLLDKKDVQVLVFEPDEENLSSTSVRVATFDDKGFLGNWPFGFFLPEA